MAIKEVKYTVNMIESERGWGQRLDEVKEFDTPEERDRFIKEYNEKYNNKASAPDWYIRPEKGPDKYVDVDPARIVTKPEPPKPTFPALMIGTIAIHKMGDISRELIHEKDGRVSGYNYFWAREEDEGNYIGSWTCGFGFFGVKFPKTSSRFATEEEQAWYKSNPPNLV